ncbi:SCO3242 family prenyltransferase [Streptomyces sp. NPDC090075]|uniref:SCO3242 family prenyltransferase n=1 Tax=Streptomyces sp. NPDC090075 TaxID=3365937 RepID=UPI00381BBBDC
MKERRRFSDLALLVRAPAALSVPGDVLAGAAAAGDPLSIRTLGAMGSSVCLYWAGMALNDYADATVDAVERPERPVPSGRVPRRTALAVAGGLTAAGLGLAAVTGGRRGLVGAVPLAGLIWAYDLGLKGTPAGPAAMAGARTLNVLTGALATAPGQWAGTALRKGAGPAALVGAHTYTLMALSRHEIHGAPARLPAVTLVASTATVVAAAAPAVRAAVREVRRSAPPLLAPGAVRPGPALTVRGSPRSTPGFTPSEPIANPVGTTPLVTVGAALAYLGAYGSAQLKAVRKPSGENLRKAVGSGILALIPLQAALTARAGAPVAAAVLGVGHPLARRLARRISPT